MGTRTFLKTSLAGCVLAFAVGAAGAVTTIGDRTCGKWVDHSPTSYQRTGDIAWLSGLMTGFAIGTSTDALSTTDGESIILWMDNYCRTHPLDYVGAGALQLFLELVHRMPKK